MSFGKKLRYARNLRKLKGEELACSMGLSPHPGQIRISEYERDKKHPKNTTVADICRVLEINPFYLMEHDPDNHVNVMQMLFELDRLYGIDLSCTDGCIQLSFDKSRKNEHIEKQLVVWLDMKQKLNSGIIDAADYESWKLSYPYDKDELAGFLEDSHGEEIFFSGNSKKILEIHMDRYIEKYIAESSDESKNRKE